MESLTKSTAMILCMNALSAIASLSKHLSRSIVSIAKKTARKKNAKRTVERPYSAVIKAEQKRNRLVHKRSQTNKRANWIHQEVWVGKIRESLRKVPKRMNLLRKRWRTYPKLMRTKYLWRTLSMKCQRNYNQLQRSNSRMRSLRSHL